MCNKLIDVIEKYITNKTEETINELDKAIAYEIKEAIKGKKKLEFKPNPYRHVTFKLVYEKENEDNSQELPMYIKWNKYKLKDFTEAHFVIFEDIKKRIDKEVSTLPIRISQKGLATCYNNTKDNKSVLKYLAKKKKERHAWIRINAAMNIHNKIFEIEKTADTKKRGRAKLNAEKMFEKKEFNNTCEIFEFINNSFSEEIYNTLKDTEIETVIWALSNASYANKDITNWVETNFKDSDITNYNIKQIANRISKKIFGYLDDSFKKAKFRDNTGNKAKFRDNTGSKLKKIFNSKRFSTITKIYDFICQQTFPNEVLDCLKKLFSEPEVACWALSHAGYSNNNIIKWIENNFNITIDTSQIIFNKNSINKRLKPFLQEYFHDFDNPVPLTETKEDNEGKKYENNIYDIEQARRMNNYFLSSQDDEIHDLNTISLDELIERQESCQAKNRFDELINSQQKAFFWKPGEKFDGEFLTAPKAIYIAFFYRWLRVCSHAKQREIAIELGVDDSRITGWKNSSHPKLAKYFPDTLFDSLKGVAPVIFHKETHEIMGMNSQNLRCYLGPFKGNKYSDIYNKKMIVWNVYELIRSDEWKEKAELVHRQKIFFEIYTHNNIEIHFQIILSNELAMHPSSRDIFIDIKAIKEVEDV